jgi:hypothetical protein
LNKKLKLLKYPLLFTLLALPMLIGIVHTFVLTQPIYMYWEWGKHTTAIGGTRTRQIESVIYTRPHTTTNQTLYNNLRPEQKAGIVNPSLRVGLIATPLWASFIAITILFREEPKNGL